MASADLQKFLDELRARMGELPKNKKIYVFCRVGLRGYIACRILTQKGYDTRNLSGGYLSTHNYKKTSTN